MDYLIFKSINNLAGKWACLDGLAIFLADYLVYFLIIAAAILFFFLNKKDRFRYLTLGVLGIFLSRVVITELIRWIWYRPRPFLTHQVTQLAEHSSSASFPSGHTTFVFALAMVVFLFDKRLGIIFFVSSFLIGLSRVFVGIHYPLDILIGILIGISSSWLVYRYLKQ